MMKSKMPRKTLFACGIAISIVNSPSLSVATLETHESMKYKKSCVSLNINDFSSSDFSQMKMSGDLWENMIHAEQVYVCFDELGIISDIVPINQISASIENL